MHVMSLLTDWSAAAAVQELHEHHPSATAGGRPHPQIICRTRQALQPHA